MSQVKMWCGLAVFVGVAGYGFANSEGLEDYVADKVFNHGKGAMMEAEARETFKDLHARLVKHDETLAKIESKGSAITTPRATVAKK